MAHEEAVSSQQSAVSEKQNQHQRPFTAESAENAEESKLNQHQRPFTAEDAEESKTFPLSYGKPGDELERVQQRAEALAVKLAQTYEELTRLLERNLGVKRQMTESEAKPDKVYQKLKQRLKMADMAPRCRWVRQGGTSCGSPQMKQHIYCFAHMQMAEARELMLKLPPPEDANAIQVGLMRIQKAVIEDTISMKKAGLLLYSMQLALTNVGQTTFGQAKDEEMVRETVDEEEAFSRQHSAVSENQHQRPFTAEGAEDAEERNQNQHQTFETQRNGGSGGDREIGTSVHRDIGSSEHQSLPRMDAEERGLRVESRPVEWTPSPDMYRMDTREGMEAYEASFRMKIRTSGDREATPPRAAVPHEPCSTSA